MPCWFTSLCSKLNVVVPNIFVETGTYMGDGIERVKNDFKEVHSLELHEGHAQNAKARFANVSNVTVHQGDSAELLELLVDKWKEPVLFYLDAHFSGGNTAFGREEDKGCPLLRELKAIASRNQDDVIVVDDMRLMGKASMGGTQGDKIYPLTHFDFQHVTVERMKEIFPNKKTHMCSDFDRLVFY